MTAVLVVAGAVAAVVVFYRVYRALLRRDLRDRGIL